MAGKTKPVLYSGTSGLVLPVPKRLFPPGFEDKSRLHYYASLFNSIEINSSFYKLPLTSTVSNWSDMVPQNFTFTFKLWKEITHNKGLSFKPEDINHFIRTINHVGDKKGCLLIQLPPSLSITYLEQLEKLLKYVHKADPEQGWKMFVEFRNRVWYHQEVYDLLSDYKTGMVIHDLPSSITPIVDFPSTVVYLRFHGPNGGYRGSYANDFLQAQASHIHDWLKDGKSVYTYFNNTMGDAVKNLMDLNNLVRTD